MKTVQITVKIGENEIFRNYELGDNNWQEIVEDMLDTIEHSNEKEF